MITTKIYVALLLVYTIQCEDSCFQKFTCEFEKAQRGHDIEIIKTDTDALCATKCCENSQCIGFDWVITTKGCYLTKTPRTDVALTYLKDTWSCEKRGDVRAEEAKSTASKPSFNIQFDNHHSRPACIIWKDYKGNEKPIASPKQLAPDAVCTQKTYGTHPFIARDCQTKELLYFTDGKRTDIIAEGLAFGAVEGKTLMLHIIAPLGPESCEVNPESRVECGWAGITKATCESRGCCFNPNWAGITWCYKTDRSNDRCMVNPENRKECGWAGITRQQCESKGCCFNNKRAGMKWCYKEREIADHFGGICHRDFKKVGCFRRDWKLLTDLLITDLDPTHPNYTIPMNWDDFALGMHSLACRCRQKAKGHYKYFAMGFHAECVAGKDTGALEKMMAKDKDSGHGCINGDLEKCDKNHKTECAGAADYDFFYEITD